MFTRIRTIGSNQYLYEETRWREGGKVKSRSTYLGALSRKRKSYSDEQAEKERAEQERVDRILVVAEKYGAREEARLKKQEADKKAAPTKDEGSKSREEPSSSLGKSDDVPKSET